jgi:hypothetical protein
MLVRIIFIYICGVGVQGQKTVNQGHLIATFRPDFEGLHKLNPNWEPVKP